MKEIIASKKGYQVTEEGKVIGLTGKYLSDKPVNKGGYHFFSFRYKGERIVVLTHRLQAYQKYGISLYDEGIVVRHKDGNSLNNCWNNILIGSQSENIMDIPKQIRIKRAVYAASHLKKYNDEEIKKYYDSVKSYKETMNKFNISSKGTLHYILNN